MAGTSLSRGNLHLPHVGVMCLTRNRRNWLPNVIRCFHRQTYPNRSMLILADGQEIGQDLVAPESWRGIRLVELSEDARPRTVGEKRNLACTMLHAEIIVVFDDDDWQAPDRIEKQVARLVGQNVSVTGYHSVTFTDGERWWKYSGTADLAIGMSLAFRRSWWERFPFPHRQIGQDEEFARAALPFGQLLSVDARGEMIGSIHPKNTSPRRTFEHPWWEITPPESGIPEGFLFPHRRP